MSAVVSRPRVSFADFLAIEARSDVKHEFLDGEIFAMAGGSPEHALIATNLV